MITAFVILLVVAVLALVAVAVISALGAAGAVLVAAPLSILFSVLSWVFKFCLKAAAVVAVIYLIYRLCRGIGQRN